MSSRGFTLIELLITVGVISVLAATAIPQYGEFKSRGFDARSASDLRNAATAEETYFVDTSQYVSCAPVEDCEDVLPNFRASEGVVLAIARVEASGLTPEYFVGTASHPGGSRTWTWDSSDDGLR